MNPERTRLVIDTDPGLDDTIAILLALGYPEKLQLEGLTTVAGNQTIERVTTNALRILDFAASTVPVCPGAEGPLQQGLAVASRIHGDDGLGGVSLPATRRTPDSRTATQFLQHQSQQGAFSIASIGPSTNLAQFFEHDGLPTSLEQIVLMGGSASAGNVTPAAEFNTWTDPEAAEKLFSSGAHLVMCGLDVTQKAYVTPDEVRQLRQRGRASQLVAQVIECYAFRYARAGWPGAAVHDACAIAYLLEPQLFSGEMRHVAVETQGRLTRGMTVVDRRPGTSAEPNTRVLLDVNRPAFVECLFEGLGRMDQLLVN